MKKSYFIKIFLVAIVIVSLFVMQVSAAVDNDIHVKCANSLVKLQIMQGDGKGNLRLSDKVKRSEFITMTIRMMGYDKDEQTENITVTFKDLTKKHWAYNNVKIALKYNLISGYPDNTIGIDKYVSFAEAEAIILRALSYQNTLAGSWPDNVVNKSIELGLNKNLDISHNKQLTRGETSVLIYNSLTVNFNKK